ncbi:hypothetical protein ACOSQ2_030753 [Xanthoceras sorbifolium]
MDIMLFSQRLRRLLAGDPDEEGSLPNGAKLHIQSLQNGVEFMSSFMRDFESSYPIVRRSELEQVILKLKREIINVIRESENVIDTFFVSSIQNKNESSSEELCDALQGLERKYTDIKLELQQVQANQTNKENNFTSIPAQVSKSSSSSGTVKRREREIINKKSTMVVREDEMERLLDFLIEGQPSLSAISICGWPGLGRSTLAAQVYDNIYVKNNFDSRIWVRVSYNYNFDRLLEGILKSLMPSSGLGEIMEKDDKWKKTTLRDHLKNKRYLIVLPDFWWSDDYDLWGDLGGILPDDGNGSRVLTTTIYPDSSCDWSLTFRLRPLNDTESWKMLTGGDFSNESSLLELETVKRSLKVICSGQPYAIMLLRGLLSGKDKQDALLMLENLCEKEDSRKTYGEFIVIYSYENLPDYLKPCFLYFTAFPKGYPVSTRQLYQLWIAEGFIEENSETTAEKYLEELTMRGFIQVKSISSRGRIKTCNAHGEIVWSKVLGATAEDFISISGFRIGETFKTCKRQSFKEDHTKFGSSKYSTQNLHSFFCHASADENLATMGCNHVFDNSKLLKVLDLGTLVVNQYPVAIENLVLLRYLKLNIPSLTSIPSSLCNLLNLYTLDMPFSRVGEAPFGIWKMHKLRHLNFAFIKLPAHPGKYCNSLENLNFISALCPSSCTEDILERLPNLLTLRIHGDLRSHQSLLSKSLAKLLCLESLKLVNENKTPELPSIVLGDYQFPPTLTQLTLSNTELKDDPMPTLEKLPNLEVLKLKRNSYKGRKLTCRLGGFPQLRVLHLKSLLWLEEWTMESGAMQRLECLHINPCAYLKRLPEELWHIKTLNQIELWWPRPELKPKLRELEDVERYDIQIYPSGL